jgi:hypothetical protein
VGPKCWKERCISFLWGYSLLVVDLQKVQLDEWINWEPISLENHEEKVCKSFYLGYTIQYSHCKHRTTGNEEKYKATSFLNLVTRKLKNTAEILAISNFLYSKLSRFSPEKTRRVFLCWHWGVNTSGSNFLVHWGHKVCFTLPMDLCALLIDSYPWCVSLYQWTCVLYWVISTLAMDWYGWCVSWYLTTHLLGTHLPGGAECLEDGWWGTTKHIIVLILTHLLVR